MVLIKNKTLKNKPSWSSFTCNNCSYDCACKCCTNTAHRSDNLPSYCHSRQMTAFITWKGGHEASIQANTYTQYARTTAVSRHQNGKQFWKLMQQKMMEVAVAHTATLIHAKLQSPPKYQLSFYRPDDLPTTQPCQSIKGITIQGNKKY